MVATSDHALDMLVLALSDQDVQLFDNELQKRTDSLHAMILRNLSAWCLTYPLDTTPDELS